MIFKPNKKEKPLNAPSIISSLNPITLIKPNDPLPMPDIVVS